MKKYLMLFILFLSAPTFFGQTTTLVDFGSSSSGNVYGLAGWNNLLLDSKMVYTSDGPGGVVLGSEFELYSDFMGVSGTARSFIPGERIVATWFNNSDETIYMTARVSFNDNDNPDLNEPAKTWFTMHDFTDYRNIIIEALPHGTVRTVFNIADAGVHKTDGQHQIVNISSYIEWGESNYKQYLICDKIELMSDADIASPAAPAGVTASAITDHSVLLDWNVPADNKGVVEYLVYNNGQVEGYTRTNSYTVYNLEPAADYSFSVTALDEIRNESDHSEPVPVTTAGFAGSADLLQPAGFEYAGAFLLPEEFSYGGEAIAFRNGGSGSLFITNLNQHQAGLVGEVSVPAPVISGGKILSELTEAAIITQPVNIRPQNVNNWPYVDVWRTGLEFVESEQRLYSSWGYHYQVGGEKTASISCCDINDLTGSTKNGAWLLGAAAAEPVDAMLNDYLFEVPQTWADANLGGQSLICGRFRDGGLSGLGPTLYSFNKIGSAIPAAGSSLDITTLLKYGSVEGTDNYNYPNSINDYKHSDAWRDAEWISAGNQSAIMFAGLKAMGDNWYGYQGENLPQQWVIADIPYPDFGITDPNGKGWRSQDYKPMVILFDPAELAEAAQGAIEAYVPQPYGAVRLDENIFWGSGEIVSAAFDETNRRLFLTEYNATDEGRLIVHVWNIEEITTGVADAKDIPLNFRLWQNYPNPFNPETNIKYVVPETGLVSLKIYNLLGKEVAVIVNEYKAPGSYQINFNAGKLASGIYYYTLKTGSYSETKKMVLLK